MLELSENISDIQIYTGSFQSFTLIYKATNIYYKERPLNTGYSGNKEERDCIAEEVIGYNPSFFAYWKKAAKNLKFLKNDYK